MKQASPFFLLGIDLILYLVFVVGCIVVPSLWLRLLLSIAAGVMVARLAILGHDAGHQGFSHSPTLNRLVGTLAFLPALHPFGRWRYHHNLIHHRFTCQLGIDNAFPPMSLEGYLAAPQWRRLKYKFLRSIWGQPFFYLLDIWLPKMFLPMPGPSTSPRYRDLLELSLVYLWLIVFLVLATLLAAKIHGLSSVQAASISFFNGFLIPFLAWNSFISFLSIVQHTSPNLHWQPASGHPSPASDIASHAVHIALPEWLDILSHRIMNHPVHHRNPGLPLWCLKREQLAFNHAHGDATSIRWSPSYHLELTRICQLYDLRNKCWCSFKKADALAAFCQPGGKRQ